MFHTGCVVVYHLSHGRVVVRVIKHSSELSLGEILQGSTRFRESELPSFWRQRGYQAWPEHPRAHPSAGLILKTTDTNV